LKFLESVRKQIFKKFEAVIVTVVDNASTDETVEDVQEIACENNQQDNSLVIHIVKLKENKGYGAGANVAIKLLSEAYPNSIDFLICNNDMELLDGCLDALYNCAYSKEDIGIVGGKLFFPDGRIQHAGAFLNVLGWGQHLVNKPLEEGIPVENVEEMEYVTGALFYVKNDLMNQLKGFDERYDIGYFEEVDFCYAARKIGYKTYYEPKATAIHYENATGNLMFGNAQEIKKQVSDRNQVKFYKKLNNNREAISYNFDNDRILFVCKIYGERSFSGVMRNLAKGMKRAGVDVAIAPEEYHNVQNMSDWEIKEMIQKPHDYWNRFVLRSCEGDHMYLMPPGRRRIAHTTGESSIVSKEWIEQLNAVDLVLTTSTFYQNVLREGGVRTPVVVLPNSINFELFDINVKKAPFPNLRSFNFFSMFHFGERKAPEILFKAFMEEFDEKEDVTLTVHALSMELALQQRNMTLSQYVNSISTKPHAPIFATQNLMAEKMIPHVLKNFDCFVLPTRGEGFGLPILEAAAMGIPSITTGYSGVTDFVTNETGWLIDYSLVNIPLQYLPYYKNYIGGQWAEPSVGSLRGLMRYAFEHRDEVKLKGDRAYYRAKQQYSIDVVGKKAKDIIFGK